MNCAGSEKPSLPVTKWNVHSDFKRHQDACARALLGGGKFVSRTRIHWGLSGRCERPREVTRYERPSADINVVHAEDLFRKKKVATRNVRVAPGTAIPLELTYEVPCGTCVACMRYKRWMWARRTEREIKATLARGGRMWFLTLTLSPVQLNAFKGIAEREAIVREGISICPESSEPGEQAAYWNTRQEVVDRLGPEVLRKQLDRVIYREIQMFLKRLREGRETARKVDVARKIPPAAFRFLCVAEAHQSGEPHYHILLHEINHARPIRQRDIEDADWKGGFLYTEQVYFPDGKTGPASWYICKYLTKEGGRPRASRFYGDVDNPKHPYRHDASSAERRAAAGGDPRDPDAEKRSEHSDSVGSTPPLPSATPKDSLGAGGLQGEPGSSAIRTTSGRLQILPEGWKRGTDP